MVEQVSSTWVVPDEGSDDLGVRVSTLNYGSNRYETMVVGGEFDGAMIRSITRAEALHNHVYWVNLLTDQYLGE